MGENKFFAKVSQKETKIPPMNAEYKTQYLWFNFINIFTKFGIITPTKEITPTNDTHNAEIITEINKSMFLTFCSSTPKDKDFSLPKIIMSSL